MSSDPAINAAEKVCERFVDPRDRIVALAAARETLAPIRDLVEELSPAEGGGEMPAPETDYSEGIDYVLSRLKPLIYPEDDL